MLQIDRPPHASRSLSEPAYPQVGDASRAILSLLLIDPGAFRTADEIAAHVGLPAPQVRASLGALMFSGLVGSGWYVTDAGRDALAEATP